MTSGAGKDEKADASPKILRARVRTRVTKPLKVAAGGDPDAILRQANEELATDPNNADAYTRRAKHLRELGKPDAALADYRRALSLRPDDALIHFWMANALQDLKRYAEAIAAYDRSLELNPINALAFNNRGNAWRELGKSHEALRDYEAALRLQPDFADAHANLGLTFNAMKRHDDANASFDRAIELAPQRAELWSNKAIALRHLRRLSDSLAACDQAITVNPRLAAAHLNRGNALQELGRHQDAIASYERAITLNPRLFNAHNNLGFTFQQLDDLAAAEIHYDKAIELKPDFADAYWNKAIVCLASGDLRRGFALYEWRQRKTEPTRTLKRNTPVWLGQETLRGKSLLVHHEQGLGDTIQFCRYIPQLHAAGASVFFSPQRPLRGLMQTLAAEFRIVDDRDRSLQTDFILPLLSAPLAFKTDLSTIPGPVPYLSAEHSRIEKWRARLGPTSLKIGVCWQGSTGQIDVGRSFEIGQFARIARLPGVRLISLHKGLGEAQLDNLPAGMQIETLGEDFDSGPDAFLDSAAVMMLCDLVITSDTAIAHLAGALGVKTWVILKKTPDWRWLLHRQDSPWYPTMRLFRQDANGDWASAFDQVRDALQELMRGDAR